MGFNLRNLSESIKKLKRRKRENKGYEGYEGNQDMESVLKSIPLEILKHINLKTRLN